jgi:SAM-dependent methyltransferase
MKNIFLKLLCCPKTKSDLTLKNPIYKNGDIIMSGELISANGEHSYPIIKGIPRFVDAELYSKSFGYEWKKWSKVQYEAQNVGKPNAGLTDEMFNLSTGFTEEDLKGKIIVEFGCGGGRYMDVVLRKGGIAVGIDLSIAVEPAMENLSHYENVLIVQGDVLNSPFKDGVFDNGYSLGVLHHTPSPADGTKELFRTIKKGGDGICLVYESNGWYGSNSIKYFRRFINGTRFIFGNSLALIYSHVSARTLYYIMPVINKIPKVGYRIVRIVENNILVVNKHPDLKWRVLDTFDAITPHYASTHTEKEVESWFKSIGCENVHKTGWNKCGWKGRKP